MARDKYHQEFKAALESDGWRVTDDPLYLKTGRIPVMIDLGAERIIIAEKGNEKIAVEIKTFSNLSFITAFYEAIGKYIVYRKALELNQDARPLYLAIPEGIFKDFDEEPLVLSVFADEHVRVIIYNPAAKTIVQWIT